MKFRRVRNTELNVSEIGMDLAVVSSPAWKRMTEGEMIALLHHAFDQGITLYDAAETYGYGRSEELLSRVFAKGRRDEIVIATKVGYDIYNLGTALFGLKGVPQNFHPTFIRYATEQALRRLKTDRIDFLQLHHPKYEQVNDDTLWQTLEALRKEGKILHYGACFGPGLGWLYESVDCIQRRGPAVIQHVFNMFEQVPGRSIQAAAYARLPHPEATVDDLPEYRHGRMEIEAQLPTSFMIRFPHNLGLLTGRLSTETLFAPEDPRSPLPRAWLVNGLRKARELSFLCGKETGRALSQAALLWLLAEKTVASCLVSIEDEEMLREYAEAPDRNPFSAEELDRVAELFDGQFGVREEETEFEGTMERET